MNIKYDEIIKILQSDIPIFSKISETALNESVQVFRILELREQETLHLAGSEGSDFLFMIIGKIEVNTGSGPIKVISPADTNKSPFLLPALPRLTEIRAIEDSFFCHVDEVMFDYLLIVEDSVNSVSEKRRIPRKYLEIVKSSDIFRRLPVEFAEKALESFQIIEAKEGDELLTVDQKGDAFYVLTSGRAELWEKDMYSGLPEKTGVLTEGAKFGEESLVTDLESPTGVKILEDSALLSLSREDFNQLLAKPLVSSVENSVAKAMLNENYQFLDLRFDVEYEMEHIPGALLISFHELRDRLSELDKETKYVLYCNSGHLGAAATFMLSQLGYHATNMEGGLRKWPFEKAEGMPGEEQPIGEVDEAPPMAKAPAQPEADQEEESSCFGPVSSKVKAEVKQAAKISNANSCTFICTKDTMSGAYPSLILALKARQMGLDALIFCTFNGVNVIRKGHIEKLKCQPGGILSAPGIEKIATAMMKSKFAKAEYPDLESMLQMALDEGVKFVACQMTMDVMEFTKDDLIEGAGVGTAEDYLKLAISSPINLFT